MNKKQMQYAAYCAYQADYSSLVAGDKPLLVVEKYKSPQAWRTIHRHMNELIGGGFFKDGDYCTINIKLDAEDGVTRDHALVLGRKTNVLGFLRLLRVRSEMPRAIFQARMGALFGYPPEEVGAFMTSETGLTCPCEMCGGDPGRTVNPPHGTADQKVRRTMVYS